MSRFLSFALICSLVVCLVDVHAQEQLDGEPDDTVFLVVENPAEYPGGLDSMFTFIRRHLKYPMSARRSNVEGAVYVAFVIEKNGSVSNISVVKGIHPECDAEAARVVSLFPNWKPGRNKRNKAVRSKFVLPIIYKLTPEARNRSKEVK